MNELRAAGMLLPVAPVRPRISSLAGRKVPARFASAWHMKAPRLAFAAKVF
jgi:hypothetical protein